MNNTQLNLDDYLNRPEVRELVRGCYGDTLERGSARFGAVADGFFTAFPDLPAPGLRFVSTPGRSELGGNHTDHNLGCVVAASIELDALAAVVPTGDNRIRLRSAGFDTLFEVDLHSLDKNPEDDDTRALLRGVAARFAELGHRVGGFAAYLESQVLPGSGMSSSAAIEVLVGTILSALYNEDRISPVELAKIGQYAENEYMGKPCGLMDQIACASGGVVAIDFAKPDAPVVTKIEVDLHSAGYRLAIIDTGGSHADLTDEYAAVPREMGAVAAALGRRKLRGTTVPELLAKARELRATVGDRALLRAIHFVRENDRAQEQRAALLTEDIGRFVSLARESGLSSWRFLQNCVTPGDPQDQPLATGLAVAEAILDGRGAARVHGGGFAGTMQVYLPVELEEEFLREMEALFGSGVVTLTGIRPLGTVAFPPVVDADTDRSS